MAFRPHEGFNVYVNPYCGIGKSGFLEKYVWDTETTSDIIDLSQPISVELLAP